jgi:hypothetical protein
MTTFTSKKVDPFSNPQDARTMCVQLAASLTLVAGTVLGQITTGGKFAAYDDENSDGTEVAKAILPYDVETDSNGQITLSTTQSTGGPQGEKLANIEVWIAGEFLESDLTGLDANGLADLDGHYLNSISGKKVIRIG